MVDSLCEGGGRGRAPEGEVPFEEVGVQGRGLGFEGGKGLVDIYGVGRACVLCLLTV